VTHHAREGRGGGGNFCAARGGGIACVRAAGEMSGEDDRLKGRE